jgi:tricorn protease
MSEPGYYRYPTIHEDSIVFCCEDDLWSVACSGGTARRLTAGSGECSMPRLSPDGSQVAYVSQDEGNAEVYLIPAGGGESRRVTYLGATCILSGWSPDGREILFASDAGSPFVRVTEGFAVDAVGGQPRNLQLGHMTSVSVSATGSMAIGRNATDPARWKRYRGGTAGEIWVDADGSGHFERVPDLPGNLVWPMWLAGRLYFLSDHEGIGNIYSCLPDGSDLTRHTHETEYYSRFPSTDGRRIVYTAGAELCLYDPGSDEVQRLAVEAPATPRQSLRKFVEGKDFLEHFSVNSAGDSLAFICRGQPLVMPFWEEAVVQYGAGSAVRYRNCEWLPDGRRIVVASDSTGSERLEVHALDQPAEPAAGTNADIGRVTEMVASPVSDMVAVANHRHELLLIDLTTQQARIVDRAPADRIADLAWSPDGRWVAYTWSPYSGTSIIRVVDAETGTTHDITSLVLADRSPSFDPEGKYLYFLSAREFKPVYDATQFELSFPQAQRPFLVTLRKDVRDPFVPKPKSIVSKESDKSGNNREGRDAAPPAVEIDFEGIAGRIVAFPAEEGRYGQIVAARRRALFTRFPLRAIGKDFSWYDEKPEAGTLLAYDFDEQRAATLHNDVSFMRLGDDHQTLVYLSRDRLRVVDALEKLPAEGEHRSAPDAAGRKSGWIDLHRLPVLVEPRKEWQQMLKEAWRLQREHFWDERMSEVDWNLVLERYGALVPRVRCRSEFSDLIWEMQGELGTSHAYEVGGDYRKPPAYKRGFLGASLVYDEASGGYRIEKILRGDSWDADSDSPLADPGLGIVEGDIIVAVGGRSVSRHLSVDELLMNSAGKPVQLTILGPGASRRPVVVTTLKDERWLGYRRWVEGNRRAVHEASQGSLGYVHIPDMGPWGFAEFHRSYLPEVHRQGLIVDVRYNRGGHVSALLLEKLARKRAGYAVSRWGIPEPYPCESVAGPIVAITNQFAGSDGDIFSHCFKLYKLGPLVGKRTWGGVIGIWPRHRLVDGTVTTQPEFSFWFSDAGWSVENYGADPDHDIDIAPHDYREGRDPQLARALELAIEALEKTPVALPSFDQRPKLPIPRTLPSSSAPTPARQT